MTGPLSLSDIPADFPMLEQIAAEYPELPFEHCSRPDALESILQPEPSDAQVRALALEMGDELLDALDFRRSDWRTAQKVMREHVEATASCVRGFLE